MEFGIKPVGVYADGPIKDDVGLKGVDFSRPSRSWARRGARSTSRRRRRSGPTSSSGDWWPAEDAYSGMEGGVKERSKKIAELAPVVGPSQGDSYRRADQGLREAGGTRSGATRRAGGARGRFDTSRGALRGGHRRQSGPHGARRQPVRTRTTRSPYPSAPPELLDFQRWGLDVIGPEEAGPRVPVLADTELRGGRHLPARPAHVRRPQLPGQLQDAGEGRRPPDRSRRSRPGAFTTWPAYWLHRYSDYADELNRLSEVIEGADPEVA